MQRLCPLRAWCERSGFKSKRKDEKAIQISTKHGASIQRLAGWPSMCLKDEHAFTGHWAFPD
eukprot:1158306-Pelagomonas_calceolata.AAC.5